MEDGNEDMRHNRTKIEDTPRPSPSSHIRKRKLFDLLKCVDHSDIATEERGYTGQLSTLDI